MHQQVGNYKNGHRSNHRQVAPVSSGDNFARDDPSQNQGES
jgi:hypothetical protein